MDHILMVDLPLSLLECKCDWETSDYVLYQEGVKTPGHTRVSHLRDNKGPRADFETIHILCSLASSQNLLVS